MGVLATSAPPAAQTSCSPASLPPTVSTTSNIHSPSCRIVSEHRKQSNRDASPNFETPTVCGPLEFKRLGRWCGRYAEVRPGELRVFRPAQTAQPRQLELRLPLRHMSLLSAEDESGLAFSLEPLRHPHLIGSSATASSLQLQPLQTFVFRTRSEQEYGRWVRSLAVELMRQTPLETLRFLDVFGITQSRPPPHPHAPSSQHHAHHIPVVATMSAPPSLVTQPRPSFKDFSIQASSDGDRGSTQQLARLMNADPLRCRLQGRADGITPLPVRQRRAMFEDMIAANTRASSMSTENLYSRVSTGEHFSRLCGGPALRACSLLDLRRAPAPVIPDLPRRSVSIREMCRIFEQGPPSTSPTPPSRPDSPEEVCLNPFLSKRRLQRGQRRLAALRERANAAEEAIWRLQEQMAELDRAEQQTAPRSRLSRAESFTTLERRLQEEERNLAALQTETSRVLRSVEQAARRLDTALVANSSCSWDQASTCSSSGVSSDSG